MFLKQDAPTRILSLPTTCSDNFQKRVHEIYTFIKTNKYAKRLSTTYPRKQVTGLGMDRYNTVGCTNPKNQSNALGENIGITNQKSKEGSNKLDAATQIPLTKKHIKLEKKLGIKIKTQKNLTKG